MRYLIMYCWIVLGGLASATAAPVVQPNVAADLRLKMDVNDREVNRGDQVYFSVAIFNDGPDAATNVQIRHVLEGAAFMSRRSDDFKEGTVEHNNGTVVCSVVSIPAGSYVIFQYFVQVTASQGTKLINRVEVIRSDSPDPNSTPNNSNVNEDDMAWIDIDVVGGGYAPTQTPTPTPPVSQPTSTNAVNPSVWVSKSSYLSNEKIVVSFSGLSGSKTDWIAVTRADLPANQFGQWMYTDGKTAGQFEYNALAAGTYEARVYFNWPDGQFTVRASVRFVVNDPTSTPTSTTPNSTPPVSLPSSGTATTADWNKNATDLRGKTGQRFTFSCPANGAPGSVWGTDVYTDDSSICGAGVHAGAITKEAGGEVTIEISAGQTSYRGSQRNGILSASYGTWYGSYTVVAGKSGSKMGSGVQLAWTDQADKYRGQNGLRLSCNCPPNGDASRLWGTDTYTDDSSICLAAVHAGLISKSNGGSFMIEIRPGQSSYVGSNRNGVSSGGYGGWAGSFVFIR
ncbi:MAG: LCCL domain-containing protein [Spirosomataceae bacterium]